MDVAINFLFPMYCFENVRTKIMVVNPLYVCHSFFIVQLSHLYKCILSPSHHPSFLSPPPGCGWAGLYLHHSWRGIPYERFHLRTSPIHASHFGSPRCLLPPPLRNSFHSILETVRPPLPLLHHPSNVCSNYSWSTTSTFYELYFVANTREGALCFSDRIEGSMWRCDRGISSDRGSYVAW